MEGAGRFSFLLLGIPIGCVAFFIMALRPWWVLYGLTIIVVLLNGLSDLLRLGVYAYDLQSLIDLSILALLGVTLVACRGKPRITILDTGILLYLLSLAFSLATVQQDWQVAMVAVRRYTAGIVLFYACANMDAPELSKRWLVCLLLLLVWLQIPVGVAQRLTTVGISLAGTSEGFDVVKGTFGLNGGAQLGWLMMMGSCIALPLAARKLLPGWLAVLQWTLSFALVVLGSVLFSMIFMLMIPALLCADDRIRSKLTRTAILTFIGLVAAGLLTVQSFPDIILGTNAHTEVGGGLARLQLYAQDSLYQDTDPIGRRASLLLVDQILVSSDPSQVIFGHGVGAFYGSKLLDQTGSLARTYPYPPYPYIWSYDYQRMLMECGFFGVGGLIAMLAFATVNTHRARKALSDPFWQGRGQRR